MSETQRPATATAASQGRRLPPRNPEITPELRAGVERQRRHIQATTGQDPLRSGRDD